MEALKTPSEVYSFDHNGGQCIVLEYEAPLSDNSGTYIYHNGYVQITKGHSLWGAKIVRLELMRLGPAITYSGDLFNSGDWWIGFDTASEMLSERKRSLEYVKEMTEKLAENIARLK